MENNSLDLLSKLLAMENITVVRQNVPTASFNIVDRTLTLPIYVNMTPTQELLLALHEVGHALMTTKKYIDNIRSHGGKSFGGFMNVIEDSRIERLMKERFPGSRKDFHAGYNYFHEVDFFKTKGTDISKLSFIDRINLDQKLGFRAGVKFSSEERVYVKMVETTVSEEDVFEVAKKIYEYSARKEQEKRESATPIEQPDEDDFFDSDEESGDYDDSEETSDSESEPDDSEPDESENEEETEEPGDDNDSDTIESSDSIQEPDAPTTQEAFDQSVNGSTDNSGKSVANISMEIVSKINIIETKEIVKMLADYYAAGVSGTYNRFKLSNQKVVNHMVKEFEMRKAADAYKRTSVSKSGSLNDNKLFKYKIVEDIFRKNNIVVDATSHGFIMLLDWSGSMARQFRSVISQVLTLTQFCRRTGIKFEVFAFSDNEELYKSAPGDYSKIQANRDVTDQNIGKLKSNEFAIVNRKNVSLLKFFDHKMSSRENEMISQMLYSGAFVRNRKFALCGTPLLQGLQFIDKYIPMFQKMMGVQKVSVITLTDGESTDSSLIGYDGFHLIPNRHMMFLKSNKTNRHYPISMVSSMSSSRDSISIFQRTMMTAIKDNHRDVNFIGFFVTKSNVGQLARNLYQYNSGSYQSFYDLMPELSKELKKNSVAEISTPGYDRLFVIEPSEAAPDIDFTQVNPDMSSAQIARQFIKTASNAVSSRVLVNKFIAQIA